MSQEVSTESRAAAILKRLIGFQSVNPPGNEEGVATFAAKLLEEAGYRVRLQEVQPGRPNVIAQLDFPDAGPTLLFNSHLDVVPPGDGWSSDPFTPLVRDGKIYGRGAVDAKGSLASMFAAAERLSSDKSLGGSLIISAVVDEESGSGGTRALFPGLTADMAIVGEPTNSRICIAHKGTSRVSLMVEGKSAHAAEPDSGVNAIEGAARLVLELQAYQEKLRERRHDLLGSPTVAVTIIQGGTKGNMIPDRCELLISRRMVPGESESTVEAELTEILNQLGRQVPPVVARIGEFFQTSGGPSETPRDDPFVRNAVTAASSVPGADTDLYGFTPNCDMSKIREAGIPTIILGPGETRLSHQANEHITVDELERSTSLYVAIAKQALNPMNIHATRE